MDTCITRTSPALLVPNFNTFADINSTFSTSLSIYALPPRRCIKHAARLSASCASRRGSPPARLPLSPTMAPLASSFVFLAALLGLPGPSLAAPAAHADPCAKIAGKAFVPPADALGCLKSFPFNETLRQNVMTVVSKVFDFYTFEDYYLNSPPPFRDSTVNIRQQLARINSTRYAVSEFSITDWGFNTITSIIREAPLTRSIAHACNDGMGVGV